MQCFSAAQVVQIFCFPQNEEQGLLEGVGQNCKKALGNPVTLFWENCENMQVCLQVSARICQVKGTVIDCKTYVFPS